MECSRIPAECLMSSFLRPLLKETWQESVAPHRERASPVASRFPSNE